MVEHAPGDGGADAPRSLAPYFDSASCLGRDDGGEARLRRLDGRHPRDTVETYVTRGRSAFFDGAPDPQWVPPLRAFEQGADSEPAAALAWLTRLNAVSDVTVAAVFAEFPSDRVSEPARRFAQAVLHYNRSRLLALRPSLEERARRAGGAS